MRRQTVRASSSIARRRSRRRGLTWSRRDSRTVPSAWKAISSRTLPAGADAYVLSRILHDWDDADAERILTSCREAIRTEEPVADRRGDHAGTRPRRPAAIRMDLHMMLLLGGTERTAAEFEMLLKRTGFRMECVAPTGSPAGLGVIEAMPAE